MKGEYIVIIIFVIILAVSLILIMLYREKIFKKKQSDKKNSLLQGYGFYSDPITLPCTNSTGKCTEASTQKTIVKCIPNPSTGKGCIDEKGHMTYDSKMSEKPCRQQCQGSLFTVQDSIAYKNISINGQENQLLQGLGCNKVANVKNGLDETDFFIGDFDTNTLKYKLRNCIPDEYQGYYVKTYTCNDYDSTGANNCRYTCGQDPSIKLNGLFDTKLSKNILMYYPLEYEQDNIRRHICYDINEVNQIEILNSVAEVPNDFYYPNICYKHVNEYNIEDNLIELYPTGRANVNSSFLNYNTIQEKYITDISKIINNFPGIVTRDYDYYYDYINYIKIQLNNEIMLINKIKIDLEGDYIVNNFNNDTIIMYINTGNNNLVNNINFIKYYDETGNANGLSVYPNQIYQIDNNQYVPVNINQMLVDQGVSVDVSPGLSTSTFTNTDNALSIGDIIYYRGEKNNYNNGQFLPIINTGTSTATVEGNITNIEQKIYWRKIKNKITNNTIDFTIERANDNKLINLNIDINDILLTNNIFLRNGQKYNNTRELMVTRNIDTLDYYNNDAFFLFSKEVETPGVKSITNGFFYPLYLKKFTHSSAIQQKGMSIYTTSTTTNTYRQDKILLNNIEEEAFYVSSIVKGVPVYYYPVYLTNNLYTDNYVFPSFDNIKLYVPKNAKLGVTEEPENYLNFNQYASLAMVYQDGNNYKYPVFLTNFFENVQIHTFENYKDITFYMPSNSNNHALDSPPLKNYNLTDFKDIFEIGTVNINLNNRILNNLSFVIPNNAQINQELFLENFNSVDSNTDIQLYQNGTSIGSMIYTTKKFSTDIISVFRNNDFLLNNTSGDSVFSQKSKLYNKILENQSRKSANNITYDIIINPEKKILIEADFKLFQSPYIENPDGSTTNICYDEYNKPLAQGTQITLNSASKGGNNNNKIVINVPCSDYNTDIGSSCGVLGLSIGAQPCQQERVGNGYIIKQDTQAINLNNSYFNEYDYMENGLNIVENKMVCLDDFRTPYDDKSETKCFPPFFTREKLSDKIYAPDEEIFLTRYKRDYYLSTSNDNTAYPLNPLYWDRIYISTPDSEVYNYQILLYNNKNNLNNYTFRINKSGVTGIDPTRLAIQPVFRKNITPYHNFEEFNHVASWWNVNNAIARNLNQGTPNNEPSPDIFNYNNILIGLGINNVKSNKTYNPEDIIEQTFNIFYTDKTISEIGLQKGDIFQTSFSFFNSLLYHLIGQYNGFKGIIKKIGVNFDVSDTSNNNFFNLESTVINYTDINSGLKAGNYLLIVPYDMTDIDDIFLVPSSFQRDLIDKNNKDLFNPSFELVLLEKIDTSKKNITVKRNIFNLNINNYFYNQKLASGSNTTTFVAYPLTDKLIDLNFPIISVDGDKLFFQITLKVTYRFVIFYGSTSFNINSLGILSFVPFMAANYIKKSITTPYAAVGNTNLYLSSLPENAKTISALLDLRVVSSDNQTFMYINEFRNSRYTTDDDFITSFQPSDIIDLELPSGKTLVLRVIRTNIFYQDDKFNKRYDYYCLLVSGTVSDIKLTNYSSNYGEYYLWYYFYGSFNPLDPAKIWYFKTQILKTIGPGNNNIICDIYEPTKINMNDILISNFTVTELSDIGFFPLENSAFASLSEVIRDNIFLMQSKIMSEGNDIAYLRLSGTTFNSSKGSISIKNIKTLGKPEGINYYPRSDININAADRKGFGSITSFQINEININHTLVEGDIFVSRNNYILRATNKNIAGYDYIDGTISKQNIITNYDINEIYSIKDIVEFVNPNQRIYFNNNTGKRTPFDQNTWQIKPESRYEESSIIDFANNESYLKDTVVRSQGRLWKALINISPSSNLPNLANTSWQLINSTENNLFSNQNNFFTFTNDSANISAEQINEFNNYNKDNYPLCLNDYVAENSYCLQPAIKFTETTPSFDNSFITVLPEAKTLANIMGQAFLTHNEDNYLSLPAVPYNLENYKNARYLNDAGDISSANNLAQYIYQIPILNNLDEGKPFCTGNWLDSGVSDIIFANSIVFFMLPLSIDSQDYPSFNVSQNGNVLTKNNFSSRNNTYFGMSLITFKDDNPIFVDIGTSDATYIIDNYDSAVKVNDKINLTKIGGGSSVTVTINKIGGYPIEPSRVSNRGTSYKLGDIWYYTNPDNVITSYGYLQPENDGGISARNFYSYYTDFETQFNSTNSNNFTIISKHGRDFDYSWDNNKYTEIIDYTISDSISFSPGDYESDEGNILKIHIADNGQGYPLQQNEYLIQSSSPANSLTDGVSAYQIFEQDSFKCRMYGMFGSDYISKIGYRLDSNLINNINQENPGLIFNNFSPDIFSNSAICVAVVSEGTSGPDYTSHFYDVFTLKSNDGTSSNISLLANNFSNKAGNIDSIPLPNAYDSNTDLREFNIVNTTDLHDLFSVPYSGTSNIYIGPINEILPVLETEPSNNVIKFSAIRQSRSRQNIGTSFDCNFYFKPQNIITSYPGGGTYTLTQKNNILYYNFSEDGSGVLTNGLTIKNGREYIFNLTSNSMDNFPLSFGLSAGSSFGNSIIKDESIVINNGTFNIFYYINNASVDYSDYIKDIFYKQKNVQRTIKLYYDTKLETMNPSTLTIYMGFNQLYNNKLVITNNQ